MKISEPPSTTTPPDDVTFGKISVGLVKIPRSHPLHRLIKRGKYEETCEQFEGIGYVGIMKQYVENMKALGMENENCEARIKH